MRLSGWGEVNELPIRKELPINDFPREVDFMNLELTDLEKKTVLHALEVYLSDLRHEITKTEKHEWKVGLHEEEDALKQVIEKLR